MRLLALFIAGPALWAVLFAAVYALHGIGCAGLTGPESLGGLWRLVMAGVWIAGLGAHVALLRALPAGRGGADRWLPLTGGWIGLGASAFTLFPVLIATSC